MSVKNINNYQDFKDVLINMIRYLDGGAFLEENLCYTKEDIETYLGEAVNDAMQEYFKEV